MGSEVNSKAEERVKKVEDRSIKLPNIKCKEKKEQLNQNRKFKNCREN